MLRFSTLSRLALALLTAAAALPAAAGAQAASLVAPDGSFDLNRFYTSDETNRILGELHVRFPELTELYAVGESLHGQPLLLMEVTNEATGPAADKPALYVDGGIHAAELTGSAVALHLLGHLLQGYGSDARVTRLLDERAFYIRPKFNPDGSDLVLIHDQFLRSSMRPVDEDEDGLFDEDPPRDLDGDGWITSMRIPDPDGGFYAHPGDSRLLVEIDDDAPAPAGARRYRVVREGVDEDGDGRINEDGFGGNDMNRNFPRNWERLHLQPGSGPFPLSEPETYATVRFLVDHPNVTGIVHGHTSGGFVYRLPSASAPSLFPRDDLELIEHLGAEYTRSTGRPVVPSATHPTEHRYGTLISWGFWDGGIIGWVPEYSPGPEAWVTDYDGDGSIDPLEEMRYNEEALGGRYFSAWTPYDHPQLGAVEIGGWHTKFWGQNPPAEHLEEETTPQLPWHLYLAEASPLLTLSEPRVEALGGGRHRVSVTVGNEGFLPTSLTGRGAVGREDDGALVEQVVRPPHATLEVG
ncbi:MAG: hypothetical protein KY453_02195, partial [Gemmatimonadetes bacterium]|nr:hypothetical protein [Gemmatimonadota bacterium]